MQIGTIQEHLQKFFGLCRCGGAFYTFVPQTAKGWQPVLLGTNCQPFFVAYAALQGHLVVRRAGRNCPTQLPSAAQRYNTLDFGSKVVCHETQARFLWILPAQRAGAAGRAAVKIQTGPAAALPRSAPQQYRPPTQRLVLHQPRSKMLATTPAHSIHSSTPPRPCHNRS